tara:strand:- start:3286 stop:9060 length:5775 start_codon:yes stop_codon:yes gene_type:complete
MAKKQPQAKIKQSQPSGFFKGMVSDVDPRLQPKSTYRDARNIKLINTSGNSLTIENEDGNKLAVDLAALYPNYEYDPTAIEYFSESKDGITDSPLDFAGNIVGHYSFKNQLLLIICGIFSDSVNDKDFRTQFLLLEFTPKGNFRTSTDLRVCYDNVGEVPNLKMDPLVSCSVAGIVENECITRVYWTDNMNSLRSFSLKADLPNLFINELDVKPQSRFSQPILDAQISGGLLSGCYSYFYKYVTDEGSVSGVSPLSNVYYVSEHAGSYIGTYGSASGVITGTGLQIKINDVDQRYDFAEIYAVYWQDLEIAPTVHEVGTIPISGTGAGEDITCFHSVTGPPVSNGLAEVLIPSNTWDVCKDIAIKDNILFAANLRSITNIVSDKEWNVKVRRSSLLNFSNADPDYGVLTTIDPLVKDYYHAEGTYDPDNVIELFTNGSYEKMTFNHTYLAHRGAHRYMPLMTDGPVLGAMSYGFSVSGTSGNELGGCRVSFNLSKKSSDTTGPRGRTTLMSYGSGSGGYGDYYTEAYTDVNQANGDGLYKAVLSNVGGEKDPGVVGNNRGYQRGETYRFGVLVYDKAGNPGNVLYIGDIQMPYHHDTYWQRDFGNYGVGSWDTSTRDDLYKIDSFAKDFRVSIDASMPIPGVANKYCKPDEDINTGSSNYGPKTNFWSTPGQSHIWNFDLGLIFEFKIPDHVREKISGFQVVRAQRKDSDRSVLQQGVLKQTVYYGKTLAQDGSDQSTTDDSSHASPFYSMIQLPYSIASNQSTALGGPTAVTGTATGTTNGGNMFWPEYDLFVGGHLGLNYYTNALWPGGNAQNYASIDDSAALQLLVMKDADGYFSQGGSDYQTNSRFFGQDQFGIYTNGTSTYSTRHMSLTCWVMYSPDSAFGLRPYRFTSQDHISIVSTMKLRDKVRTQISSEILGFYDYGGVSGAVRTGYMINYATPEANIDQASEFWQYGGWMATNDRGDYYSSIKRQDNAERATVVSGQWSVYDTYFHHYISDWVTGGDGNNSYFNVDKLYVTRSDHKTLNSFNIPTNYGVDGGVTPSDQTSPWSQVINVGSASIRKMTAQYYNGNYFRLASGKQLYDGEIVDSSFFETQNSGSWPTGGNSGGFTNHSLTFAHLSDGSAAWGEGPVAPYLDGANFTVNQSAKSSNANTNGLVGGSAYRFMGESNRYSQTYSQISRGTRGILLNISKASVNPLFQGNFNYSNRETEDDQFQGAPDLARVLVDQNYHTSNGSKSQMARKHKKIPYCVLANIVRDNPAQYGGNRKDAIENTRYIAAGNFHPIIEDRVGHTSIVFGGDTFVTLYSHQATTSPYPRFSRSSFEIFPVESYVNTALRSGFHLANNDTEVGFDQQSEYVSNDWLYNPVYSQEKSLKRFVSVRETDCASLELPYQISYSQTKLRGEPYDAFRTFPYLNFHDVEGAYGEITGLINHNNEIYFTQEKAFGKLLINPRTFINDATTSTQLFTGQGQTLETEQYISNVYGSRHTRSLINSNLALYFFDVDNEKIIQFIDKKGLRVLSDEKGIKSKLSSYINKGRLKAFDNYHADINGRVKRNDMPLNFIGIHGTFDYKTRRVFYTILDGLRVDPTDRSDYPDGDGVYTGTVPTLGINPWMPTHSGGYADRWRINNTVIYNEELDVFTSFSDFCPPHYINHQGYIYTTKNRFAFNIWNVSCVGYPDRVNGTNIYYVGHPDYADVNMTTAETAGVWKSNTIKMGALQLWKYGAGDIPNWFYGDRMYTTNTGINNPSEELQYDANGNDLREINSSSKIIQTSILDFAINDFSTVNKKFDNLKIYVTSKKLETVDLGNVYHYQNRVSVDGIVEQDDSSSFGSLFYKATFTTDNSKLGVYAFETRTGNNHKYREGILRFPLRTNIPDITNSTDTLYEFEKSRMTGTFLTTKLYSAMEEKFNIFAISSKFRKSYN